MTDELVHYGVKGMKWGVSRERMEATTLSKSERKEARKNLHKLSNKVIDTKYADGFFGRRMSEEQYNKLSTKAHTVKKGQTVGRITQRKDEKFEEMTYVSYKPNDRTIYRATMPVVTGTLKRGGDKRYKNSYEATFKTLETLRSPSEKERVDAFAALFDTPSIKLKNGKTVTGRQFLKRTYPKEVKTLTSQQLGMRFYHDFTENQYAKTPLNSAYFKEVQKRGYNSIVDDNDRNYLSNSPLIVLNPNGTLKKMKVKTLSADDINNAQRTLKVETPAKTSEGGDS